MGEKGKFIALEGIDGSGKSAHAGFITDYLRRRGYTVFYTEEPSRGRIGRLLREYLKDESTLSLADAFLFAADRAEHLQHEIMPAIKEGKIVVCERYKFSSFAYQSVQGQDIKMLKDIHFFAPDPDLTILLDLEPKAGVERCSRGEKFETEDFLTKVRDAYLDLAKEFPNFHIVDATPDKMTVKDNVIKVVQDFLDNNGHPRPDQE
jgi:dTMP kinase|tara:strand:+ start:1633 stop:2250 length:618 start_codon:yes stop_codon:yes gene_type:complete